MTANKRIKQGVMYVVLILLSIYTLFPIYFLIVNSFKSQKEIVGSPISLPLLLTSLISRMRQHRSNSENL